ncbi:MAG: hypothetical protein P8Z49_05195 [Acidobacteriota bacterium]
MMKSRWVRKLAYLFPAMLLVVLLHGPPTQLGTTNQPIVQGGVFGCPICAALRASLGWPTPPAVVPKAPSPSLPVVFCVTQLPLNAHSTPRTARGPPPTFPIF